MQVKNTKVLLDKQDLMNKLAVVSKRSKVNQEIASYFEKNYAAIVFLTADQVGHNIGVSQGSISRFCIKMGYKGYNDFLRYLQKIVSTEITSSKRAVFLDNQEMSASGILDQEVNNISELVDLTQSENYKKIVQELVEEKQVILLSDRMSATLLPYMNYILARLRDNVSIPQEATPAWENLDFQNPTESIIFTIVLPRYSRNLISKLSDLHKRGFRIIALTDSQLSPVSQLAEYILVTPITISSIFDVYSTPLLLINLLMRDIAKESPNLKQRLSEIETQNRKNKAFI